VTVCYLAGPMTGLPEFNYPEFHRRARQLRDLGVTVRSPAEIDYREDLHPRGTLPAGEYLRCGLRLMLTCETLILLPGWGASKGAQLEVHVAVACGMPVHLFDDYVKKVTGGG
jgi:hypothetical protein